MEDRRYTYDDEYSRSARSEDDIPVRRTHSEQSEIPRRSAKKRRKKVSAMRIILGDALLTAVLLLSFAFIHHVLPRMNASKVEMPTPVSVATPAPTVQPVIETPQPTDDIPDGPTETEPPVIDNRTPWQKRFEDKFTDEVIKTDHSYSSPNVSIDISRNTFTTPEGYETVYFVADIYIAQIENFQTYFANGTLTYYGYQNPTAIARDAQAIVSINGDYADNQLEGFLVRNGQLYYDQQTTCDICVLYYDGTMATYAPDEYTVADELEKKPYQVWKFGPALLSSDGTPLADFNISNEIAWENPRSGVGYYEPGHYCFVMADGRQGGYSRGLTIGEFAKVFSDMGCIQAYNMDGGASAIMTYDGAVYNRPSNGGRDSGDILLIRELEADGKEG